MTWAAFPAKVAISRTVTSLAPLIEACHRVVDDDDALRQLRVTLQGGEKEGQCQRLAISGAQRVFEGGGCRGAPIAVERDPAVADEQVITAARVAAGLRRFDIREAETGIELAQVMIEALLVDGKNTLAMGIEVAAHLALARFRFLFHTVCLQVLPADAVIRGGIALPGDTQAFEIMRRG